MEGGAARGAPRALMLSDGASLTQRGSPRPETRGVNLTLTGICLKKQQLLKNALSNNVFF